MRRALEAASDRVLSDARNPRLIIPLAAIILAIVAVLVVLPKTGEADQSALQVTPASGQTAGTVAKPLLVHVHAPSIGPRVPYGTPDPFREPPKPKTKPKTKSNTTDTAASGSASTGSDVTTPPATGTAQNTATTPASGATTTPATATTTPTKAPVPEFTFAKGATTDLRFGVAGKTLGFHKNIHGSSPFPTTTNVAVLFVGVLQNDNTAVFLSSKGATESGMGKCLPSRTNCVYFELKPGQREHILAEEQGGGSTLYDLKYVKPGTAAKG